MRKKIGLGILISLIITLSGCGEVTATYVLSKTDTVCIQGVKYLTWSTKYGRGATVMFNTESKVIKCYSNKKAKQ